MQLRDNNLIRPADPNPAQGMVVVVREGFPTWHDSIHAPCQVVEDFDMEEDYG